MKLQRVRCLVLLAMQVLLITACQTVESPPSPKSYTVPPNFFTRFSGIWIGSGGIFLGKELRPGYFEEQLTIYQLKIASSGEATITITDATGTHTKPFGRFSALNETTLIDGPATSSSGKVYWNTYELEGDRLIRREHGPNSMRRPFIYKRLQ